MNKKFTSRILSMLLAVLMLISMMPTSVFAAPASDIPAEMLDNVFLDALEYTGYKVQAQRDDGTIFKKYSGGATAYLSKISYGLNKYGTETVAKSGTATGLAPDIAGFESSGLCCASFVSYVYYNYLPNIAGIDTSSATRPYNLRTATAYNAAANAWVSAGTARRISFSQNANGNNFIPSEDIPIGSLIIFKHIPTGDIAHVAVYAGYYNGTHFVFHVGNDRGPEISSIVGMSKGDYPEAVVQVVTPEFVEAAGKIEVYKKDPKGAALSGAYFIATNTSTGAEYAIGPTDSRGYACTKERLPFGTYKIVETVFPTDYTYSGTKEWTRTVSASNNGVVTIQAVNELKKGNIEVYKKSSGTNEALKGAIFTVYDMSGAKVTTIGPTNDRGYAKSADIPYGSYRVVETTFPFNYEPDGQTEWKVTIDTAHGSLATVNAYNRLKKGHIEVLKSDAESGKDLSGAEFTVYDLAGEEIAVIGPTDKNGYAKSGEIIYGDYIVKETKVPVNYQPDGDAQWKVTIDDNSPLITLDIANLRQYGMVKVRKTAEDGLVEGLTFRLTGTSEYGESVDMTAVTNAVGTAVFERVPIGTDYTLSEENTPERYVIPEVQNISVEWNKVTERQFDNILKKWRADVLKVDASLRSNGGHENLQMLSLDSDSIVENLGYPYGETQGDATLAGAVYGVYRYDELVDTYVTDKNGYFLTDYYPCGEGWNIREITPSEGYLLDETVYWLGVTPGQYTLEKNTEELDVYEDIIFGSLYLIKHMDDGSTGLETVEAGAEFEVFLKTAGSYENARDTERDYLITNEHGYAGTKQLPYPTANLLPGYGPDAEDAEVNVPGKDGNPDNYDYPDRESAVFVFDENGVFQKEQCGVYNDNGITRWINNGMLVWHAGLVKDGDDYRYFKRNGMVTSVETYVAKTNDLLPAAKYTFDAEGKLMKLEGLHEDLNGNLCYYVVYVKNYAGLVEVDGSYYYIASDLKAVKNGTYYVTKTNGLKDAGFYSFDADGKMIIKNGLVEENGDLYYYVDGAKTAAGLIEWEGNYYYIASNLKAVKDAKHYVFADKANGLKPAGWYWFNADGTMFLEGIREDNGTKYYYKDGVKNYAGLVKIDDAYYYVKSDCTVVCGRSYYVTKANGLMPNAVYTFGADGKMEIKNGIYREKLGDGNEYLFYYVNNVRQVNTGLVQLDDGSYIYVRSGANLAVGSYYVSKTNDLLPKGTYTFGEDGKMIIS